MISAFEVYLVMQLDTIAAGALVACLICGVGGLALLFFGIEEGERWAKVSGFFVFSFAALCGLTATFLPSSKTAAAMIIVPALTSEEVVEPVAAEAKELYQLAKEALREVAKPDKGEGDGRP